MANRFVDIGTGSNSDTGENFDLAWATTEYAWESGALSPGDFVFTRPNHLEIPTDHIAPVYDGLANQFITVLAWPKPAFSITSATWTNGSTTVDLVLPATLTRNGHAGRMILAPNGFIYFITYIVDSNTFLIDRAYSGSTVSGVSGAATIAADPYYNMAQAIDDSSTTIKKADWNANNPARPVISFNNAAYRLSFAMDQYQRLQGFEIKDSIDVTGILQMFTDAQVIVKGCLIKQSSSNTCLVNISRTSSIIDECIIEGSGAGASQVGITAGRGAAGGGNILVRNSAIYNCGSYGIQTFRPLYLDNMNIGIEQPNGDEDISNASLMFGKDVRCGGTNGGPTIYSLYGGNLAYFENYQKILGAHRTLFLGGYYQNVQVSGETPNKKLSDEIIKIVPNISGFDYIPEMAVYVFEDELNGVPAGTYDFGYWIYNDSGVTLNVGDPMLNIWLEVEFLGEADGANNFVTTKKYSTLQDIDDAADADDWDKLIVSSCTIPTASKIVAKIYFSKYLAATHVFVDTKETEN